MSESDIIQTQEIENDFYHFISSVENNKRLFFTGRFGIGKTFFLKNFFEAHKDEFESFHLFPVRYQISSNEDIIDLLKYDVLVELLKKDKHVFAEQETRGVSGHVALVLAFLRERGSVNKILQSLVGNATDLADISPDAFTQVLGKLGRPLQDLLEVDRQFQEFKKEYKTGEKGLMQKFLDEMSQRSLTETDYVTQLLKDKIQKQKGSKRSVLILDDLDRIDPEHIFRILNVFSSHLLDGENNKFGFDHVIVVADRENIRNVFHHKYGPQTDFQGYIDKFYSVRPYSLNNKTVISERIPQLVKQIKCEETDLKNAIGEGGYIKLLLSEVLSRAVMIDRLNLRELYKPIIHNFPELTNGVYREDPFEDNFRKIVDIGVKLLFAIYGNDQACFTSTLKEIRDNIKDDDDTGRAPYAAYIGAMMVSLSNPKPGMQTYWNNYLFTIPATGSLKGTNIDGVKAVHVRFFYDALIEYMKSGKYAKRGNREYDR